MPISRRPHDLQVPVVSNDPRFLAEVTAMLTDPRLSPRSDAEEVLALLEREPFAGLIVDGRMPLRMATRLGQAYVRHQPFGRVAILAGPEDITTLVAFAFRDPRCDLFFHPWDKYAVLNFLRVMRESETAREPVAIES